MSNIEPETYTFHLGPDFRPLSPTFLKLISIIEFDEDLISKCLNPNHWRLGLAQSQLNLDYNNRHAIQNPLRFHLYINGQLGKVHPN